MNVQTIFQAGNSNVVAIPSQLMKDLDLKTGNKVIVDRLTDSDALIIYPKKSKTNRLKPTDREYQTWLNQFLKEDAELLDELATR